MSTIYEQLKASGVKIETKSSDLLVPVTPITQAIVDGYEFKKNVTTFIDNIDHELWFEIPFAFDEFWERGPVMWAQDQGSLLERHWALVNWGKAWAAKMHPTHPEAKLKAEQKIGEDSQS